MNSLYVAAGGALGAVLRYLFSSLNASFFPFGTVVVNTAGSFLLGCLTALAMRKKWRKETSLFLGTGFCGGFTTMSSFSREAVEMIQTNMLLGSLYIAVSVVSGMTAALIGLKLAEGSRREEKR
ncbi:fluoride efflux transporter FluC [Bacillus xiapuensis]|uniref:fluoride efflux transporter FluC n=1 Tax=Bacillus xiapuensis TaxID=2014075 RepID=UPI000C236B88|nr:CrcB family protein [Bacillus xiapuensis]